MRWERLVGIKSHSQAKERGCIDQVCSLHYPPNFPPCSSTGTR